MAQSPRGLRNNNPLNIRKSPARWIGKITPGRDREFEQFDTLEHGVRAAVVIIRTYITRYQVNTPAAIISRWAPSSENNTQAYIDYVTKNALLSPHQPLALSQTLAIGRLVWAMACYECGQRQNYDQYQRIVNVALGRA